MGPAHSRPGACCALPVSPHSPARQPPSSGHARGDNALSLCPRLLLYYPAPRISTVQNCTSGHVQYLPGCGLMLDECVQYKIRKWLRPSCGLNFSLPCDALCNGPYSRAAAAASCGKRNRSPGPPAACSEWMDGAPDCQKSTNREARVPTGLESHISRPRSPRLLVMPRIFFFLVCTCAISTTLSCHFSTFAYDTYPGLDDDDAEDDDDDKLPLTVVSQHAASEYE